MAGLLVILHAAMSPSEVQAQSGTTRSGPAVFLPIGTLLPSAKASIQPQPATATARASEAARKPNRAGGPSKIAPGVEPLPPSIPVKPLDAGATEPEKWSAILHIKTDLSCTATLIGTRVLLTAAHCVQRERIFRVEVAVAVEPGQTKPVYRPIDVHCEAHPRYRPQGILAKLDYALCLLSEDFPETMWALKPVAEAGPDRPPMVHYWKEVAVEFERLSLDPNDARFQLSDQRSRVVLLSGMGCTDRNNPYRGDGIGRLSAGLSLITSRDPLRLTIGSQGRRDSATICQGDSGGAAFRLFTPEPDGRRRIVGVNSTNSIVNGAVQQVSFLVKTSAQTFAEFFRSWRRRHNNPKVCGIDADIEHRCHA